MKKEEPKSKCIVLTSFGNSFAHHEATAKAIAHVHAKIPSVDIHIYRDNDHLYELECKFHTVKSLWPGHPREHYRNSDYYRIKAMLDLDYDLCCYLDLDMRIVAAEDFMQGFDLAERFGLCVPINPRSFVGIDSVFGGDPSGNPPTTKATAYNASPLFLNMNRLQMQRFCRFYVDAIRLSPARGPAVLAETVCATRTVPYVLSQEWCMCEPIERYALKTYRIWPIVVHAHTPEMKQFYEETVQARQDAKGNKKVHETRKI